MKYPILSLLLTICLFVSTNINAQQVPVSTTFEMTASAWIEAYGFNKSARCYNLDVDWIVKNEGVRVKSWSLESIDNTPEIAWASWYKVRFYAELINPMDTANFVEYRSFAKENNRLEGLEITGLVPQIAREYGLGSEYYTGEMNRDFWQRRVARIEYQDASDELKSGRLFFAKDQSLILFFADSDLTPEVRAENKMKEEIKKLEQAKQEVSDKLNNLGDVRGHLFDDYLYCFAAEYQMDYSPGYPSEAFTTPTTTFSFFVSNKRMVKDSDLTQFGRKTVADGASLIGIELVDSVKTEDYFLNGVRLDGFGFPEQIFASEENALHLEYNKLYSEYKPIYLAKETWFMIPEEKWGACADLVQDRCTGVSLPSISMDIPKKQTIKNGEYVNVNIPGTVIFGKDQISFDGLKIESKGGGMYKFYDTSVDPVIDSRPLLVVGYEPKYGTFEMIPTNLSYGTAVEMTQGSPIRCSPGAIKTYVTIDGNVFIAKAVRDVAYEMEAEKLRKEEEERERRNKEFLATIAQTHGQKYVDAFNRLDIIVGMPEELAVLLMNEYYLIKNTSSSSSGTLYQCESRFESNSGLWITISSGKVTYISTF
tara:strand:- start:1482 stop:3266 length:1785 start_codon:yes stop_codon:yes gene_type:complete